ncbi:MAG: M61 family metallopeptidase, partial [Lewinella sp.]|nr:M61 family metallopeptidase [Lewinella sp.]
DSFRDKYVSDLKKIVETGSAVIGDIPYKHYTFIIMGRGGGGLEHSNSMAVYSGRNYSLSDAPGYKRWLAFLSHEYFHLYNIKSIRPINLGPFDYDRENLTHMLWVSEGFTVYFEYFIVNQGGLMNREETLEAFTHNITNYEYLPGSRVQSATESSYDTWLQFFNRSDNADNTAISYYDKGCILGLLMDLKIRHETKGKKSLTDVMRTLYRTYFQELKRGFTDDEFREVCEKTAGVSLEEIFRYASTTEPIDYGKYLAYAGMAIDTKPAELPGAFWGATVQERNNNLTVTAIEQGSPAWQSGLSTQDQLLEINGQPATRELLDKTLGAASAGDPITVKVTRRTGEKTITCSLSKKSRPGFRISPLPGATPEQVAIRDQWLAPDRK